jgi:hypothetical protein
MTTTVMTTAVATTSTTTTSMTATFRGGIPNGRQQGHERNDGNPDIEF